MFSTGSPYSPFFTSGLLSSPLFDIDSPSSSRAPSPDIPLGPRRGSLPTDAPLTRSPPADESAAFYFTLQPKRDQSEHRSFLSLDLAESQSMRSASLKRKASSKRSKPRTISRIPEAPRLLAPSSPLRLRYSRDSFRSIPSPKPAPSITLPELPHQASSRATTPTTSAPPRLPSIPIISSLNINLPRSSQFNISLPPLRISRTKAPTAVVTLPHRQRASVLSQATTVSSVSTRVRKINRSDALARLEGRSKSISKLADLPSLPNGQRRNFMSMSDDDEDDDDDGDIDDLDVTSDSDSPLAAHAFVSYLEPEDLVIPSNSLPTSPISYSSKLSSHLLRRNSSNPKPSPRRKHSRRSTKDWFPLKSFIDLRNDDESSTWSWRSFIDVANLP